VAVQLVIWGSFLAYLVAVRKLFKPGSSGSGFRARAR